MAKKAVSDHSEAILQRIRDPIHDLIEFDASNFERMCWSVINTYPFQRLRRIKQLGFSELVYPGATHSRFSHSVGVFHTARQLGQVLKRRRADAYDIRRGQEAIAAALVHDLGHGPFSHAFESVLKKLGLQRHESTSVRIINETEVADALNTFVPRFAADVAKIVGSKLPGDMEASIVVSQFDADRLDYMRRDQFMTGAHGSGIDFKWLLANLEVRRVTIGQDEKPVKEIETLVVGPKAVLSAEAYVLGLFHLYPTIYFHKTTRCAERLFSALLIRIITLAKNDGAKSTGLPGGHPLLMFAVDHESLDNFLRLDDTVVWGSLPLLAKANDKCIKELAERLSTRKLYKAIDATAQLEATFSRIESAPERDEAVRRAEAQIRDKLNDSKLLEFGDEAPKVMDDQVNRDPYQLNPGDEAALEKIYAIDRSGDLKELSGLSPVVAALKPFNAYRVYYREEDSSTERELNSIIEGVGK